MKYAVVTGGTSGIGMGVARMLLGKGYYVFATYIGPDFTEEIENFEAIKTDQRMMQTCVNTKAGSRRRANLATCARVSLHDVKDLEK